MIRMIAAFQVLFGHMVVHLKLPISATLFHATYFFRGVPIFFVISGFLIWFSIGRSKSYKEYLMKRFWRIYPELWGAVVIGTIVIVALYHDWNLKQFMMFNIAQGTILQFWTPDSLRGYGVGTPNGTLWTIGIMIQFYLIAWFFYRLLKGRSISIWIVGFCLLFVISYGAGTIIQDILRIDILYKLYSQTIVMYFWLFYIGMFIAEFKDDILPKLMVFWYMLLIVGALFFVFEVDLFSGYYLFWSVFLTSGLIGFAYSYPRLSIKLDISYAIFLYQMIVMNIFVNFGLIRDWCYALEVIALTIICASISTITVGKWSARQKCVLKS